MTPIVFANRLRIMNSAHSAHTAHTAHNVHHKVALHRRKRKFAQKMPREERIGSRKCTCRASRPRLGRHPTFPIFRRKEPGQWKMCLPRYSEVKATSIQLTSSFSTKSIHLTTEPTY